MKKLIFAVMLGVALSSVAVAAPQPPPAAGLITPNDGYVIFGNPDGEIFSAGTGLCPPGTGVEYDEGAHAHCLTPGGGVVPTTSAQDVLDRRYGPGLAMIVGYAPMGVGYTVVYFRLLK